MKIIFTGDLSASGIFYSKIKNSENVFSQEITSFFNQANFVHVNLENPITNQPFRKDKRGAALRAPLEVVNLLQKNNINICLLANNHIVDCGKAGLLDTISILNKNNILYYGISNKPKYIILKKENMRIALISSAHIEGPMGNENRLGPYFLNNRRIKKIIEEIKKNENVDSIIYNYHGGTEYNIIPEPQRRRFFKELINYGVDIVFGHHAHVPQGVERHKNGIIFYGLGNLVFDLKSQKDKAYTNLSYFIELNFKKNKPVEFMEHFYYIDYKMGRIILLQDDSIKKRIKNKIQVFKDEEEYKQAWLEESYRVYLFNRKIDFFSSNLPNNEINKNNNKQKKRNILNRILSLIKRLSLDSIKSNKRPFVIGAIKRGLKYGVRR